MKEFTVEMMNAIQHASNEVCGTKDFARYKMPMSYKLKEGQRWKFCSYSIPYCKGIIKSVKGKTYIITEDSTGLNRYEITETVKELLNKVNKE